MTTIKSRKSTTDPLSQPSSVPPRPTAPTPSPAPTPNHWQRRCVALTHHPWLITTAGFLALISGTSLFLLFLLFRGAWSQHQNNVAILQTILKMELTRKDTWTLGDDSQQVVTRTYLTLEPHFSQSGWVWINRFGSTITYGNQDRRMIVSCSPYSPLYLICDLSEIP